jgi:hypothetical protein
VDELRDIVVSYWVFGRSSGEDGRLGLEVWGESGFRTQKGGEFGDAGTRVLVVVSRDGI